MKWKWLVAALVAGSLIACGDDESGSGGEEVQCGLDEIKVGNTCRSAPGDAGRGENDVDNPPAPDTGDDASTGSDTSPDVPSTGGCGFGQSRCVDDDTIERCTDPENSTWTPETCPGESFCEQDACRQVICTPNEIVGCRGNARLICSERGGTSNELPCGAGETCRDGECTSEICLPGETICSAETQVQTCNAEQTGYIDSETCVDGTLCDEGRCKTLCELNSKSKSYLGCDYWSVDLDNIEEEGPGGQRLPYAIVISNPTDAPAEITITRTDGTVLPFANSTVQPGELEIFSMPTNFRLDGSGIHTNNAFHVSSTVPVTAHQFNPLNGENVFTNDASLLLPTTSLGYEYYVMAWRQAGTGLGARQSNTTVVATEDGTTNVTVTASSAAASGPGVAALAAGATATYQLERGEVLTLGSNRSIEGGDMTGTFISADQPVSVFGGNECAIVPDGVPYCDHIESQLFPLESWGSTYIFTPFKARSVAQTDTVVILAGESGAQINTTPLIPQNGASMDAGQALSLQRAEAFALTATSPVLMGHFLHGSNYPGFNRSGPCAPSGIGDPAFTLVVPVEQYREDYIFLTPPGYLENYVNIVMLLGTSVTLDGQVIDASQGTEIPGSGYVYVQHTLPSSQAVHRATSEAAFGLTAYGYDCDVSYAYPGGLNLSTERDRQ